MSLPHLLIYTPDSPSSKLPSKFLPQTLPARAFATHLITSFPDATQLLLTQSPALLILECEGADDVSRKSTKDLIRRVRYGTGAAGLRPFILLWSSRASSDARERWYWISQGVNMVCFDRIALNKLVDAILYLQKNVARKSADELVSCSYCAAEMDLTRLHYHVPLYHAQASEGTVCTVCQSSTACLSQHLKDSHPVAQSTLPSFLSDDLAHLSIQSLSTPSASKKSRIPVFVLVVCKRQSDSRYLLVDELASQGWYLPGGRVELNEDLVDAAKRETLAETGIEIDVRGLLRTEYTPSKHGFRLRVVLYAEPKSETQAAKCIPNDKSSGACWVTIQQLDQRVVEGTKGFSNISLPLRGPEAVEWIQYEHEGGAIWPLDCLAREKDEVVKVEDPWQRVKQLEQQLSGEQESALRESKANFTKQQQRKYVETTAPEYDDGGDTVQGNSADEEDLEIPQQSEAFDFGDSEVTTVQVSVRDDQGNDTDHFDWINNSPKKAVRREIFQRMKSDGNDIVVLPNSRRGKKQL